MTEAQAIMDYVETYGSITPAKMHAKVHKGHFFGSEVTRACRSLRAKGKLVSKQAGKFTEFSLPEGVASGIEKRYIRVGGELREVLVHPRR